MKSKVISAIVAGLFGVAEPAWSACQKYPEVCVEPAETRVISGRPIFKECWRYETQYVCDGGTTDGCEELKKQGCYDSGVQKCITTDDAGKCEVYDKKYICQEKVDGPDILDCSGGSVCVDGTCFDTGYDPDNSFGGAIGGMETGREIGKYGKDEGFGIFGGVDEQCREGYAGLKKCCKKSSGAKSNQAMMGGPGGFITQAGVSSAVGAAGAAFEFYASPYVYDLMYSSVGSFGDSVASVALENTVAWTERFGGDWQVDEAGNIMLGGGSFNAWNVTNMSQFGFTVGWGGASTMPGTSVIAGTASPGSFAIQFNPYMLAAQVAIMVVMELMSCEQEEQMLGMHREAGLCTYVGSHCSKKIKYIGCVETKKTYCCFNSKLARIINEQGRPQLGRDYGTSKNPNCYGFTPEEIGKIDFSKIDMSEFIADAMKEIRNPTDDQIKKMGEFSAGNTKKILDSGSNLTAASSYIGDKRHENLFASSMHGSLAKPDVNWTYTPTITIPQKQVVGAIQPAVSGARVEVYVADGLGKPSRMIGAGSTNSAGAFAVNLSEEPNRLVYIVAAGGVSKLTMGSNPFKYEAVVPFNVPEAYRIKLSTMGNSAVREFHADILETNNVEITYRNSLEYAARQNKYNGNVYSY